MSGKPPPDEYFVVGGPVVAGRACYLQRETDARLLEALAAGRSCYVFGPRHSGKTSLMLHAAQQLRRDEGWRVALVDFTQIGAREHTGDAGRWFYSFAYRVLRELRIKAPLQAWWQERSRLTASQRLLEFFRDLVLEETTERIAVFVDDVECAETLPFAADVLASLRACLNARATDAAMRRICFVHIGVTSAERLAPDPNLAPFAVSEALALPDFTAAEILPLAEGLPMPSDLAEAALARVHYWTGGHPYLTQKVCRALARGGTAESPDAVDRLIDERLLAPAAARAEPMFNHVVSRLHGHGERWRRRLLGAYGRICKIGNMPADPRSAVQERLRLLGLVVEEEGRLRVRNRIYGEVFTPRWVNQQLPMEWGGLAAALVLALLLVGIPLWYMQYMPRDAIAVLSAGAPEDGEVLDAYRRLQAWPGHAATADRLLLDVLERRSQRMDAFRSVRSLHEAAAFLTGRSAEADALLAEYWRRRAQHAENQEARDEALLAAVQAARLDPGMGPQVRRLAGEDYAHLVATLRPAGGVATWVWADGELVIADRNLQVQRHMPDGRSAAEPFTATALRFVPVTATVDRPAAEHGSVAIEVRLAPAVLPQGLLVWLRPPAGETRAVRLESSVDGVWHATVALDGSAVPAGPWQLTLASTETARTLQWASAAIAPAGSPLEHVRIDRELPAAQAEPQSRLLLSADGRRVVAIPALAQQRSALVVWSVLQQRQQAVAAYPPGTLHSGFSPDGSRIWLREEGRLTLLDAADGGVVAEVGLPAGAGAELWLAEDGGALAWWSADEDGGVRIEWLDLASGEPAGEEWLDRLPAPGTRVAGHTLGPAADDTLAPAWDRAAGSGRAAVATAGDRARIVRTADGAALSPALRHPGSDARMRLIDDGDLLATYDAHVLRVWRAAEPRLAHPLHAQVSVVNLGPDGGDALLGFRDGRVGILPAAELARNQASLRAPLLGYLARTAPLVDYLGHTSEVRTLVMSEDRRQVASGSADGVIRLWSTLSGEPLPPFIRHADGGLHALLFSPRGEQLLSLAANGARLWGTRDGRELRRFTVAGRPAAAAFAPAGGVLAIADSTGGVVLWNLEDETAPPSLLRADAAVAGLLFLEQGDLLVSADQAGRLQLWDARTLQRLGPPVVLSGEVDGLLARGDSTLVVLARDWLHFLAVTDRRLTTRHAFFLPLEVEPRSLRAADDGALVALGREEHLRRLTLPADEETDQPVDALLQAPWPDLLGLQLDQEGRVQPRRR